MDNLNTTGSCRNCGFLCSQVPAQGYVPAIVETSIAQRRSGQVQRYWPNPSTNLPVTVRCYVGAADLHGEINEERERTGGSEDNQNEVIAVIDKDRQCPKWMRHVPGFTPSMQLEVRMFEKLETSRREWERRVEQDRRAYEATQEAVRAAAEARERRWDKGLAVLGIVIAAIALGAVTPDSLIVSWIAQLFSNTGTGSPPTAP